MALGLSALTGAAASLVQAGSVLLARTDPLRTADTIAIAIGVAASAAWSLSIVWIGEHESRVRRAILSLRNGVIVCAIGLAAAEVPRIAAGPRAGVDLSTLVSIVVALPVLVPSSLVAGLAFYLVARWLRG